MGVPVRLPVTAAPGCLTCHVLTDKTNKQYKKHTTKLNHRPIKSIKGLIGVKIIFTLGKKERTHSSEGRIARKQQQKKSRCVSAIYRK